MIMHACAWVVASEKHIPYTKGLHTVLVRMSSCSDPPHILRLGHMRWQASIHVSGGIVQENTLDRLNRKRAEQTITESNRIYHSRTE